MIQFTVIYSLSTLPFFDKNPTGDFSLDRFELYTAALSSLTRKKAGNTTVMHCDSRGEKYIREIGLIDVWDEVTHTIPDDLDGINPRMFWAAGKLFALKATPCPVLMLDTDFIAWQLPEFGKGITAAHREPLFEKAYPDISHFNMDDGYTFNKEFNYNAQPLNTAFLYINSNQFKDDYVEQSLDFMRSALP
ncbi:MAG: hypothetical protein FWG33_05050, partial [Oscillospiraceae bacterium]|nr:hypothetical protein [Oscillospiraceae bacterium]